MRLQLHDDISCREIVLSRTLSFQNIRCRPPTSTFLYLLPSPTGNPPWLSCSSTVGCEKIELIPVVTKHQITAPQPPPTRYRDFGFHQSLAYHLEHTCRLIA
ncbi:hypothetical protein BDV35DRAFT_166073 [Aspergillus flavus]|uniref:Uncharacterized protein n=1 Tax=Aspergillus flavus TaxID=5059 RepID=A0A5N6HE45_ASPFL|nr:hypothetical protein BDV35DRAFT_166073 [Aspergillus flavus]